ncbi:ZIP zinc transporter-domain-containing protein [Paraphysoderma sedebokerense]|nr:ZIP zinc transporter-domain-containing protein [Paraphysoderma sedebokerense]
MQVKRAFRLCTMCAFSALLLLSCSNAVVGQFKPTAKDIFAELFSKFGSRIDGVQGRVITVERLDTVYESIGLFNSSVPDPHAGHNHLKKRQVPERKVGPECILPAQLLEVYNISTPYVNEAQFQTISPGLVYLKVSNACAPLPAESKNADADKLSTSEVWIYALLANLIITLSAMIGLVLLPIIFRYPKYGKAVLLFMVGLGVGTLMSDALLHLIPVVLGVHSHAEDDGSHAHEPKPDADPLVVMLLTVVGAYSFFLIEKIISFVAEKLSAKVDGTTTESQSHAHAHHHHHHHPELGGKYKPVGFLVLIGDGFHNFVDGLAIGVSFAKSWRLGIGTSLAVLLHEVTHELSDFAVLLSSGFSPLRAAMYNAFSNLPAFLGCILGITVFAAPGANVNWTNYILSFTAGVFLYIALADLVPMLHENGSELDCVVPKITNKSLEKGKENETVVFGTELDEREPCSGIFNRRFMAANAGIIVGSVAMVLLGLYEEKIKV